MRTTLKIELIGFGLDKKRRKDWLGWNKSDSYVSLITSYDYHTATFHEIVKAGYLDYSRANSVGSRGIYQFYFLDDGLYKVVRRSSWKKVEEYFLLIHNGEQQRLNFQEAIAWLEQNTKNTSV